MPVMPGGQSLMHSSTYISPSQSQQHAPTHTTQEIATHILNSCYTHKKAEACMENNYQLQILQQNTTA